MLDIKDNDKLTIQSKTENLVLVDNLIDELIDKYNIKEQHEANIRISVSEAVTNAIQHGNGEDAGKDVKVEYEYNEDEIRFVISDQGSGFDFNNLPDPTAPENLEKERGRGVYVMRALADQVQFEDDGRIVELLFYLT